MKFRKLRWDGACSRCGVATPASTPAWWDASAKAVICTTCLPRASKVDRPTTPLPPPPTIDHGEAGISAQQEYERRRERHDKQIEDKWGTGRLGRFAKFMSDEPQSTASWRIGAEGERQLAVRLNRELIECGVVLHDRNHPGTNGNIDHLVIAPSGVWIVDAKNYTGKVERRDKGGWFKSDDRLYVGGRDRTKLVAGLTWQVGHVQAVLEPVGFAAAPIHPVLCFIDADWAWFAKPIELDGVLIIWPGALCERILQPGDLEPGVIDILARELSSKLPAAK